jgi:multidrug efflux pump
VRCRWTSGSPIVSKQDADAQPVIWVALNSSRYSPLDLTTMAERQIKPRFQGVPGVSSITIGGEKRYRHAVVAGFRTHGGAPRDGARRATRADVSRTSNCPAAGWRTSTGEMTILTRG